MSGEYRSSVCPQCVPLPVSLYHTVFGSDEAPGSSFPVDFHGQGKNKTLCPQSREPRGFIAQP